MKGNKGSRGIIKVKFLQDNTLYVAGKKLMYCALTYQLFTSANLDNS